VSAIVVGEITADGSTIILIGQGPGEVLAGFAQRMQLLTPLVKNTEPRGGLQLPASWPAVVQLANALGAAWRPGPSLTAWVTDQVARRVAPPAELAVTPPPGLVPRSYQVEGACMIGANGRALLFDDPRTGKTITTILGLVRARRGRSPGHAGRRRLPGLGGRFVGAALPRVGAALDGARLARNQPPAPRRCR